MQSGGKIFAAFESHFFAVAGMIFKSERGVRTFRAIQNAIGDIGCQALWGGCGYILGLSFETVDQRFTIDLLDDVSHFDARFKGLGIENLCYDYVLLNQRRRKPGGASPK